MIPFQIVPIDILHIKPMAAMEVECFSDPWSEQAFVGELTNPHAVYRVAERQGEVLGYAGMHDILGEGYITNVAVCPAFRRQGVGTALIESLLEYGREKTLELLTLEVRVSNQAAIALYSRFGFQKVGQRKNYYRMPQEDALLMTVYLQENP